MNSLSWNFFCIISKYLKKMSYGCCWFIQNIATNVVEAIQDPYKVDDWVAVKFGSEWFPGQVLEVYDTWNFIIMPVCGHCITL